MNIYFFFKIFCIYSVSSCYCRCRKFFIE